MYAKDPEFVLTGIADGSLDPDALAEHVPLPDGVELPPAERVDEADERQAWSALTAAAVDDTPEGDGATPGAATDLRTLFEADTEDRR
jgi:hypothetical protein